MLTLREIKFGIPYWARCKRNNQLAVVAFYGRDLFIQTVKGTDNCQFMQVPHDYDILEPVHPPASVFDALSTAKAKKQPTTTN